MREVALGESRENPININVIPMLNIMFCLILFFMCSFHFKQLEGRIDSWLPKQKGILAGPGLSVIIDQVRVRLEWDPQTQRVLRKVGAVECLPGEEISWQDKMLGLIKTSYEDMQRLGKRDVPVSIDADPDVPWQEVITVMDICKRGNIDKIEFAPPRLKRSEQDR
jgi:biopolymer transport protein ExbD